MRSKKEVKEYLQELKDQYSDWDLSDVDTEELQIIEIQIETLEWVLS